MYEEGAVELPQTQPAAGVEETPLRRARSARTWTRASEAVLETIIRACGISAILFVFGIFFFVLREGSGYLIHGLNIRQFLTSTEWYPTSQSNVRYGALALIVGTFSVTTVAMLIAVPFGIGAAVF